MKKFMNPLVDAGFKRIFGRKMYMREFLNDLPRTADLQELCGRRL